MQQLKVGGEKCCIFPLLSQQQDGNLSVEGLTEGALHDDVECAVGDVAVDVEGLSALGVARHLVS